jgi:hypothetical protein
MFYSLFNLLEFIMSVFGDAVLGLLAQYKQLLKRMIPDKKEREKKLSFLALDYQYSRDSDYQLYGKLAAVLQDIEIYCEAGKNEGYYHYSGVLRFRDHLSAYISQYHIDNKNVVHCTQLASKYMIEVIQLAALSSDLLCDGKIIRRLAEANQKIAVYGIAEQHKRHLENLGKYRDINPAFFDGMINNFNKAVTDTVTVAVPEGEIGTYSLEGDEVVAS